MRGLVSAGAILGALALASCTPVATADEPLRKEFAEACFQLAAHRTTKPARRKPYCSCIYDSTMRGLSNEVRPFAQFYLLQQVGIDARSKNLIDTPEIGAMVKASHAIGAATRRCR